MAKKPGPEPIKIKKAVALRYQPPQDAAPTVSAKGRGKVADKIIDLAREYGVPIKEDPDLVEVLAQLEVEEEIPPDVYVAVAEILSFIYRNNEQWRQRFKGVSGL
jgi:flagellar biosynthesis protein